MDVTFYYLYKGENKENDRELFIQYHRSFKKSDFSATFHYSNEYLLYQLFIINKFERTYNT